jgi:hypothetical protein
MSTVADKIPPLEERRSMEVVDDMHRRLARGLMESLVDGQVRFFPRSGLALQRVNHNTMRCIVCSSLSLANLGEFKAMFECLGMDFQIDPYTVVRDDEDSFDCGGGLA